MSASWVFRIASTRYISYNALNLNDQDSLNSAVGGKLSGIKIPRECLKIIESKSKVRQSRSKAIVSKVSTSSSTPAVSSDVAELKDMGKDLSLPELSLTCMTIEASGPVLSLNRSVSPSGLFNGGKSSSYLGDFVVVVLKPDPEYLNSGRSFLKTSRAWIDFTKILKDEEKARSYQGSKSPKASHRWRETLDIKGVDPEFCVLGVVYGITVAPSNDVNDLIPNSIGNYLLRIRRTLATAVAPPTSPDFIRPGGSTDTPVPRIEVDAEPISLPPVDSLPMSHPVYMFTESDPREDTEEITRMMRQRMVRCDEEDEERGGATSARLTLPSFTADEPVFHLLAISLHQTAEIEETSNHDYYFTITTYLTITTLQGSAFSYYRITNTSTTTHFTFYPYHHLLTVGMIFPSLSSLPARGCIYPYRLRYGESEKESFLLLELQTGSRDRLWICQHADAKEDDQGIRRCRGRRALLKLHERDTRDLLLYTEDARIVGIVLSQRFAMASANGFLFLLMGDRIDLPGTVWWCRRKEAYASRGGWGSFNRIEPGDSSSGASDHAVIM
ncbi:hypothetical protein Tco_0106065 [Tanacetum coccineum]